MVYINKVKCKKCNKLLTKCKCNDINTDTHCIVLFGENAGKRILKNNYKKIKNKTIIQNLWRIIRNKNK